ncbi:MAG TPA: ATP-grasp domain-containing protein [Candidatus Micrarchaeia archaeon]|nr:ATP-grasp domain-containing protein [Candidatus Micrarchaeia archaeon]
MTEPADRPARSGPVYVGADAVPALATELTVICADACGIGGDRPLQVTEAGSRTSPSAVSVLEQEPVRRRLRAEASWVIVWKPSVRVAGLVREAGVPLANAGAAVARRLENKVHFARTAPDAWLPIPPTVVGAAGPVLLEQALQLAPPWVVQLARGYSGRHTHRVETAEQLAVTLEAYAGRSCRVATWIAGEPVTVTGVVGDDAVTLGVPCRQVTGVAACTPHPLGSCGNDFGQPVAGAQAVLSVAARAASWLQREGHRGIFGADLVVAAEDTVFCIEVNPRLVASVPLWNLSLRDQGRPSLLAHHVAAFAGPAAGALPERLTCGWSQLILHNLHGEQRTTGLTSAVGRVAADGRWEPRSTLGIAGPGPGQAAVVVHRRAGPYQEQARVILEGAVLDPGGRLLPRPAALVEDLRRRLDAVPA